MLVKAAVCSDEMNKVHLMLKNMTKLTIEMPPCKQVASLKHGTILELSEMSAKPAEPQ